jgi:hypothetical protein
MREDILSQQGTIDRDENLIEHLTLPFEEISGMIRMARQLQGKDNTIRKSLLRECPNKSDVIY